MRIFDGAGWLDVCHWRKRWALKSAMAGLVAADHAADACEYLRWPMLLGRLAPEYAIIQAGDVCVFRVDMRLSLIKKR